MINTCTVFETQITTGAGGRILTNANVWSPDSRWIVYDTRSDAMGSVFDGARIEMVEVATGAVRVLYESQRGACSGMATFHPREQRVVFVTGPADPTPDWQYGPAHRQCVTVEIDRPGAATNVDGRDLSPPRTPGALRGGSHVPMYSPDGEWLSFTYNDHLLSARPNPVSNGDIDQRTVGVGAPFGPVRVPADHPRHQDGGFFCVLATRTTARPRPGSDEIALAQEEGWIGTNGYRRADGSWQRRALAFQGTVAADSGRSVAEVFVVDLPEDPTQASPEGPLAGTATRRPVLPLGTAQRRLTFTTDRRFPGLQGPRHWLRSSPDGSRIAFLMRDAAGAVQLWTVSPNGGPMRQVTHHLFDIASAFTWHPAGGRIAYVADGSVFTVDVASGKSDRLTARPIDPADAPLSLACVYSPDGKRIVYLRRVLDSSDTYAPASNQIFVVEAE